MYLDCIQRTSEYIRNFIGFFGYMCEYILEVGVPIPNFLFPTDDGIGNVSYLYPRSKNTSQLGVFSCKASLRRYEKCNFIKNSV